MSGYNNKNSSNNKRRGYPSHQQQQDEEEVDDLAIAASYAMAVAPSTTNNNPTAEDDENEIDIEQDDGFNKDPALSTKAAAAPSFRLDAALLDYDSSSDSESDDDDAMVLERMMGEEVMDEEDDHDDANHRPPKTANELDEIILKQSQFGVRPDEQEALERCQQQPSTLQLQIAGTIQQYIAGDHVWVVGAATSSNSAYSRNPLPVCLEAGTLLVMQYPTTSVAKNAREVIPFGKVLEVFGPVRQPMYSVVPVSTMNTDTTRQDSSSLHSETTRDMSSAVTTSNGTSSTRRAPVTAATSTSTTTDAVVVDPWSATGSYTTYLRNALLAKQQPITLYYLPDCAMVLDPRSIPQTKGSDASNLHDEEVTNPQEMDFSDDEQEQQARKSQRNRNHNNTDNWRGQGQAPYNETRPTRQDSSQASGAGSMPHIPQGFHPSYQLRGLPVQHQLPLLPPSDTTTPASDTVYFD